MPLARKAFHASGVIIPALYGFAPIGKAFAATALAGIAIALGILDLARRGDRAIDERFRAIFGAILDPKDHRGFNGSTLYFAGCALAVALFPREVACAAVGALALGDPAAAIVGSSVRSPRLGRVSLAGSAACFAAAALACMPFVEPPRALLGGAVATVAEALSGSKLDNLAIPVAVASALRLL
jgi:dolichol kinase